ncbi:MAG: element excision factor XisI family protein [Crocosphaera sp.]
MIKFGFNVITRSDGVANDLVTAGIPKNDIVLAFHPPKLRQYTDFAAI